jgi:hypothetical protein
MQHAPQQQHYDVILSFVVMAMNAVALGSSLRHIAALTHRAEQ